MPWPRAASWIGPADQAGHPPPPPHFPPPPAHDLPTLAHPSSRGEVAPPSGVPTKSRWLGADFVGWWGAGWGAIAPTTKPRVGYRPCLREARRAAG